MSLKKIMFTSLMVFSFLGTTLGGTVVSADSTANVGTSQNKSLGQSSTGTAKTKGTLQLNDVPSLSFHNTDNPSKDVLNPDNSNNNKLVVTDYRDNPGWSLNASITNLTPAEGTNNSYIPHNAGDWKMNLDTSNITNYENSSNAPKSNNGNSNSLDINSETKSTSTTSSNILTTNDTNNGYGVNELDFNNNNATSLDVPNVRSGNYNITMNWSLSANVSSGNTGA